MNRDDGQHAWASQQSIETTYPVFGTLVRFHCNGEVARDLADASFAAWNVLRGEDRSGLQAVDCAAVVLAAGTVPDALPHYTISAESVEVRHGDLALHASRPQREGIVRVPQSYLAQHPAEFQRLYLDCMVQFLASHQDRVPLHASVSVVHDRPVLLCGASCSGKSTLLYTLLRAGFPILAEESVCVARAGGVALWGLAQEIGLRARALAFFPELSAAKPQKQPNGRMKHVVPVPPGQRAYPKQAGPFTLAFLGEEAGLAATEISREAARERLLVNREPGFDLAQDYADAVDALLAESRCRLVPRGDSPSATLQHLLAQ